MRYGWLIWVILLSVSLLWGCSGHKCDGANCSGQNCPTGEKRDASTGKCIPDNPGGGGGDCGMSALEKEVLSLVNAERAKVNAKPLACHTKLVTASKEWSQSQCKAQKLSHDNLQSRIKKTGVKYFSIGENVAYGKSNAAGVMSQWMVSKGHRENILNASFTHIGVGHDPCQGGIKHFWTQIFMQSQ